MNREIIERQFAERRHAVEELRTLVDEFDGRDFDAEAQAKYDRLNTDINALDARINGGLDAIDREARADEARARLESLARPTAPVAQVSSDEAELRRLVTGEIRAAEFRDVLKGTASAGGYAVPTSFYRTLIEHLYERSSIMTAGVTILRTESGEDIQIPTTSSYTTASVVAEAGTIGESDPAFSQVTLQAFKYAHLTQASSELLTDSAVDILGFLARVGGNALGDKIAEHLVAGSGSSQPNGIVTAATSAVAAASASLTSDNLIDLYHAPVSGYRRNGKWLMKDSTAAYIRKLKDTTNQYLWQPGLVAGQPDSLFGRPVVTDPNCDAIATGKKSVIFGDLSGYYVRMVGGVRVEASEDYAWANDLVTFRFILRADGDLVDTNALKAIKHA